MLKDTLSSWYKPRDFRSTRYSPYPRQAAFSFCRSIYLRRLLPIGTAGTFERRCSSRTRTLPAGGQTLHGIPPVHRHHDNHQERLLLRRKSKGR